MNTNYLDHEACYVAKIICWSPQHFAGLQLSLHASPEIAGAVT